MEKLYIIASNGELCHYGVPGMKWGVRRYENPDGSLTSAGKKRIAKEYDRNAKKTMRKLSKGYNALYLKAYNKAADDMNRGGIERFNSDQRKKYGENYAKRDGYMQDYNKQFGNRVAKYMDKSLNDFYKNDKHFKKAEGLVKKYSMTEWHEAARRNSETIAELRRNIENDNYND